MNQLFASQPFLRLTALGFCAGAGTFALNHCITQLTEKYSQKSNAKVTDIVRPMFSALVAIGASCVGISFLKERSFAHYAAATLGAFLPASYAVINRYLNRSEGPGARDDRDSDTVRPASRTEHSKSPLPARTDEAHRACEDLSPVPDEATARHEPEIARRESPNIEEFENVQELAVDRTGLESRIRNLEVRTERMDRLVQGLTVARRAAAEMVEGIIAHVLSHDAQEGLTAEVYGAREDLPLVAKAASRRAHEGEELKEENDALAEANQHDEEAREGARATLAETQIDLNQLETKGSKNQSRVKDNESAFREIYESYREMSRRLDRLEAQNTAAEMVEGIIANVLSQDAQERLTAEVHGAREDLPLVAKAASRHTLDYEALARLTTELAEQQENDELAHLAAVFTEEEIDKRNRGDEDAIGEPLDISDEAAFGILGGPEDETEAREGDFWTTAAEIETICEQQKVVQANIRTDQANIRAEMANLRFLAEEVAQGEESDSESSSDSEYNYSSEFEYYSESAYSSDSEYSYSGEFDYDSESAYSTDPENSSVSEFGSESEYSEEEIG